METLAASCCQILKHSCLTRLFFKASDSPSGLLRAGLTSELSCSVPFLSLDAHREILSYTNEQQNQVWHQLSFHIPLLMAVWLCQPSPIWKGPCPFSTNTLTYHEKSSVYQVPSFCFCIIHCPGQQGALGTAPQMTRHNYSTVETSREEQQLPK